MRARVTLVSGSSPKEESIQETMTPPCCPKEGKPKEGNPEVQPLVKRVASFSSGPNFEQVASSSSGPNFEQVKDP